MPGSQTTGLSVFFYPFDDTFFTRVQGEERLPVKYEVEQKEGRSYKAHRLTLYDQEAGLVRYRENDEPGASVIVPTFANDKRHEVVVRAREWTHFDKTLLGPVDVIEVLPRMTFEGLYDKSAIR